MNYILRIAHLKIALQWAFLGWAIPRVIKFCGPLYTSLGNVLQ